MKTTIAGIEFTEQPPTKPGWYLMHDPDCADGDIDCFPVLLSWTVQETNIRLMYSARLIPVTEVEAAFREGCKAFSVDRFEEVQAWEESRARKVTEGTL